MPDPSVWIARYPSSRFQCETKLLDEENTVEFIVHSSGSTGPPKPISMTHRQCLDNYLRSGMSGFLTTPLFHNHDLATVFRGMVSGEKTGIFNAKLPLTNSNLVIAMRAANTESFHCVPYILKVHAETTEGIKELAKAKLVSFGGSSYRGDLGDMLIENGVNLIAQFGATEVGQLLSSRRDDKTAKAWNYLRPYPKAKPYLLFDEVAEETGIFELVVLDGLLTKSISNSNNPHDSFRSQDTFVKHPTISNAWKFVSRSDDRVNLVTGEKVLPVPFEHHIRQNELVQDCLVFGVGQAFPGLLIFASEASRGLSSDDILDLLWPTIQHANVRASDFSRGPREMVLIMPAGDKYPCTDKGTIVRAACYKQYEVVIENAYQKLRVRIRAKC
ncbi:hypothetical protein TMatcc_007967 [Talaromyces marneffei ATCC 18224]|nr:uncharacterized protein EYB26_004876 [Talaromyces marneffei]KAE8552658.1 hypothetical protein EYB25_004037 [Talaromyces marneffei]QGA17206.1 hypothetical protein EYB26_004876 [Talaromyces marneffei]